VAVGVFGVVGCDGGVLVVGWWSLVRGLCQGWWGFGVWTLLLGEGGRGVCWEFALSGGGSLGLGEEGLLMGALVRAESCLAFVL